MRYQILLKPKSSIPYPKVERQETKSLATRFSLEISFFSGKCKKSLVGSISPEVKYLMFGKLGRPLLLLKMYLMASPHLAKSHP
jgi:hypothetical protein